MSPIIKAEELRALPESSYILVEAGSGKPAAENFKKRHLKRAIYADLEEDLSEIPADAANGGRHPLPSTKKFADVLQKSGISRDSHVVVYDDKKASNAAARLWWMLKAAEIEKVQVLDGGFQTAEQAGFTVTDEILKSTPSESFDLKDWLLPTINIDEVEANATSEHFTLIDVRDAYRYRGESEPIDPVAGHIPGAINIPFQHNLNDDGTFKTQQELREMYSSVFDKAGAANVAVYCGSGVTACHTLLAMNIAGLPMPKLYTGSWSEWCRNNKTIATEL